MKRALKILRIENLKSLTSIISIDPIIRFFLVPGSGEQVSWCRELARPTTGH